MRWETCRQRATASDCSPRNTPSLHCLRERELTVSALIERMEDRSTSTLMSEGLAQLRGRARQAAAETA